MILIWSVVVILVILGGWWWLKELEWKTTAENAKLTEHLEQPTHSDGYSWTNKATAHVFQGIWLGNKESVTLKAPGVWMVQGPST